MKIIEIFKKIMEVKNNNLAFLDVGDIILAKRYKTEEEQQRIKIGHQMSPHVIIKKAGNKVYALQCTSNPHKEIKWKKIYYPLGRFNYNMNKNSYIYCLEMHELDKIQFVEIIGHLSETDLNQLKKYLYILIKSKMNRKPNLSLKDVNFELSVGDIILFNNQRYYINSISNGEYECFKLRSKITLENSILINNTYYSFMFDKPVMLKVSNKYELVDTFNTGEVATINDYKEAYLEKMKRGVNSKRLGVGSIMDYKGNMFYIYKENEESIFGFRIFSNEIYERGMADILVNNGMYKTYFNAMEISKVKLNKVGYKIRRCASLEEIKYNEEIFSLPKHLRDKKRKALNTSMSHRGGKIVDTIRPMMILYNQINNNYYLVLSRKDNIIELVNINDISDLYYFQLAKDACPFEYYRIISKEEFDIYLKRIKEFRDMVATFA